MVQRHPKRRSLCLSITIEPLEPCPYYKQSRCISPTSQRLKTVHVGHLIRLSSGCRGGYQRCHAAVWPEVLSKISECNIRNYSIFFKDNFLFGYFEYHGTDIKGDLGKDADPKTQMMVNCGANQDPLPSRKEGEWWAEWKKIFID